MKKDSKKTKKWKPTKKFWAGVTIDMKTGKTISEEYVVGETKEAEEALENEFSERIIQCWKIAWGDKFDWFMNNLKYLIDKHGEKEFFKEWNKAMRSNKKAR